MYAPLDPWCRKAVQITCDDTCAAAGNGDEDAILLDDEMRARNRGTVVVFARPGDNIWKLGLEALQVSVDSYPDSRPINTLHEPGHA